MTGQLAAQVTAALADLHPDPFVQAAILRLYDQAPVLLEAVTAVRLAAAHAEPVEYVQYPAMVSV